MSVKSFDALAGNTRRGWSQQAHDLYDASSAAFSTEIAERVDLGAQLAAARKERRMSQHVVAERAGVQQAEISRIERGVSNPTVDTISKVVHALGMKLTLSPAV